MPCTMLKTGSTIVRKKILALLEVEIQGPGGHKQKCKLIYLKYYKGKV